MTEPRKNDKVQEQAGKRDNPEQYPTENESLFDRFKSEQTVDSLPIEDIKLEQQEEKDGEHIKRSSSSQNAFPEGESEDDSDIVR
ncbi:MULTISPECIES: hypothetical protein [Paenibacillus]|uniref:Uncharacterized protein n=1 Tax=Paenibacillus bovis TaxID=1616788 RepID=A0A172ZG28_9BACL|nr:MULTISPECIES: hypothetical protein [Paenibacillus]ANF96611.1 hypothetical protein AR543_11745 [Paenibacillus bovis]